MISLSWLFVNVKYYFFSAVVVDTSIPQGSKFETTLCCHASNAPWHNTKRASQLPSGFIFVCFCPFLFYFISLGHCWTPPRTRARFLCVVSEQMLWRCWATKVNLYKEQNKYALSTLQVKSKKNNKIKQNKNAQNYDQTCKHRHVLCSKQEFSRRQVSKFADVSLWVQFVIVS